MNVAIAALFATAVGVASGLAHISHLNVAPYAGGIVGTSALLVGFAMGLDPSHAIAMELGVIGSIIFGTFAVAGKLRWIS